VCSSSIQAHFRDKLVDENNHTDSADEPTQERSAKHRVEETKSAESGCENDSARKASDHACYLSVLPACFVRVVS
jgi:hypothetical protein